MHKLKNFFVSFMSFLAFFAVLPSYAGDDLISTFPLDNYDQNVATWINPNDPGFNRPLLDKGLQQQYMQILYDHYFGASSPWNAEHVTQIMQQSSPNDLLSLEQSLIKNFSNAGKSADQLGYGENFRPYTNDWITNIAQNINLSQFNGMSYQSNHRGIAIDNLHARVLPTDDVYFYSYKLAGQGYPFDNLQMSALWAGTPVYIIGESADHAWMLVITPDYIGWVKSSGIAHVDDNFVSVWSNSAKDKLTAITHTQTSLIDADGKYMLTAYVGSIFPATSASGEAINLLVPAANTDGNAIIKNVSVSSQNASLMPMAATPHNFSRLMNTLIGRPYGWGSLYFYNDCSAELKSLFTPFGIWLPRHSSDQVTVGKMVDMSSAPQEQRISYLINNGQRFLTLIYIGGHVVLYIGNYPNPYDGSVMAMTYQNLWGLSPNPPTRRAVIGESVLFPMLLQYPEDTSLISLANKKYFQVAYLNQIPHPKFLMRSMSFDLKSLMYPESLDN